MFFDWTYIYLQFICLCMYVGMIWCFYVVHAYGVCTVYTYILYLLVCLPIHPSMHACVYTVYVSRYYTGYVYYVYMPCMVFILYIYIYVYIYINLYISPSICPSMHVCFVCILCMHSVYVSRCYCDVCSVCILFMYTMYGRYTIVYIYMCVLGVYYIYINSSVHPPMHVLCVYTMYL